MNITDIEIRHRLRLGEDSCWGFKKIEFSGDHPKSLQKDGLADEMIAFANAKGGILLCGVSDGGGFQEMSPKQAAALSRALIELSVDTVEPALRIDVQKRELDGRIFLLVGVPEGYFVHKHDGNAYIRVGQTKRLIGEDECIWLSHERVQRQYRFDQQAVPNTSFETLLERLWEPLISATKADDPHLALANLRLLTSDEFGVDRATVAGVLLCTDSPQEWLPQATIMARMYRGRDRSSDQLDTHEIQGPLSVQIADAMKFVARNMRVAARKTSAREDIPQYSLAAVFEAVVNAVVHRDYSRSPPTYSAFDVQKLVGN